VNAWRLALSILEQLQPKTVLLAWDADWRHNPHVAYSLGECAKCLNKQSFCVQMEDWSPDQGKGIDDILLAGHRPKVRPWQAAIAAKRQGTARRRTF
jgi:hypothetical protein